MTRSEDGKRVKAFESAYDNCSKGFSKAIKELTNKNEPKQIEAEYPKIFYKNCVAITDKEKSEMFKQLLKDTMKNHETALKVSIKARRLAIRFNLSCTN